MVTPELIRTILLTNDRAVERAMVILLSRQTEGEKYGERTVESNGKGFSAFHAKTGTYMAKWVLYMTPGQVNQHKDIAVMCQQFLSGNNPGRPITGCWLLKARKCALFHAKQIIEVAEAKEASLAALAHVA